MGKDRGAGPRYCPSIEDKVVRFPDRDRHQIFIEPEGLGTEELYLNGISSSLPEDVQSAFIHTIEGLEKAQIMRPATRSSTITSTLRPSFPPWRASLLKIFSSPGKPTGRAGMRKRRARA